VEISKALKLVLNQGLQKILDGDRFEYRLRGVFGVEIQKQLSTIMTEVFLQSYQANAGIVPATYVLLTLSHILSPPLSLPEP